MTSKLPPQLNLLRRHNVRQIWVWDRWNITLQFRKVHRINFRNFWNSNWLLKNPQKMSLSVIPPQLGWMWSCPSSMKRVTSNIRHSTRPTHLSPTISSHKKVAAETMILVGFLLLDMYSDISGYLSWRIGVSCNVLLIACTVINFASD